MTLANPAAIALQNLWLNWVFYAGFVLVTLLTGAWLGVLIAFVLASATSFAHRRFVNKTSASVLHLPTDPSINHRLPLHCSSSRLTVECAVCRVLVFSSLPAAPRKSAVLVTGCSSGIGLDAAARLVKCGFLTFATVRKESDISALKQRCGNSNMLYPLIVDVTKEQQIKAAVETVKQRLQQDGRQLLGVVNNAGSDNTPHAPSIFTQHTASGEEWTAPVCSCPPQSQQSLTRLRLLSP